MRKLILLKLSVCACVALLILTACQNKNQVTDLVTDESAQLNTIVWIDRMGGVEPINIPARNYIYAQLSPDETRVALNVRDETSDIWIFNLQQERLQQLSHDQEPNIGPLWTQDGRLMYTKVVDGIQEIVIQDADESSQPDQMSILSAKAKYPTSYSQDGQTLIYHTSTDAYDIWLLSLLGGNKSTRELLAGPYRETNGVLSPNEQWLAYESDESGILEIYISPFPDVNQGRIKISEGGGTRPLWSPDGTELFFITEHEEGLSGSLMAVTFESMEALSPSVPALLFENNFIAPNAGHQVYDISEDGQRFLMIQSVLQNND